MSILEGSEWEVPAASADRSGDVYKLTWRASPGVEHTARFEIVSGDGRAVIQEHFVMRQRRDGKLQTDRDEDPELDLVPELLQVLMLEDGVTPVEEQKTAGRWE